MQIVPTRKQELLLGIRDVDKLLFGGARGGAKTYGVSALKAILEVVEWYSESEVREQKINVSGFRDTGDYRDEHITEKCYYKYVIDYPDYIAVIVRRTIPQLKANTKVECEKVYPLFGGRWNEDEKTWFFPSGARVLYKSVRLERDLEFFRGPSFCRLIVEELTQFDKKEIEEMETCVRGIYAGGRIRPMCLYTTNPGGKGHQWVKETFVDKCPPKPDGDPIFLEEYNLTYTPLTHGEVFVNEAGERLLYLPSLVFDNPHIGEKYIRNLLNKSETLRRMYLFAD